MSKFDVEYDFDNQLKNRDKVVVLFYASWCPFSQRFLPVFEEYARSNPKICMRVMIDDKPSLCERFSVDHFPTVIIFKSGKIANRLDAEPGMGLNKRQLAEFVSNL